MVVTTVPSPASRAVTWTALFYVATVPFDIVPIASGRSATPFAALLLIGVWTVNKLRRPVKVSAPPIAIMFMWAYSVWALLSFFWAVDQGRTVQSLATLLLQLPVVIVLSSLLPAMWPKALVVLGGATTALASAVLLQRGEAFSGGRANVAGVDENVTALVLAVGFAVLVHIALEAKFRYAVLSLLAAVVTASAVVGTGSRSGVVAVGSVIGVVLVQSVARSKPSPRLVFGSLAVVVGILMAYVQLSRSGQVPDRVTDLFRSGATLDDTNRGLIVELYLRSFGEWFLRGVGYGNDAAYLAKSQGIFYHAHSLFWKTWIELGLPGLIFLGGLATVLLRHASGSVAPTALAKMAGPILVFAVTLGGEQTSVFWLVVALGLARASGKPVRRAAHPQRRASAGVNR